MLVLLPALLGLACSTGFLCMVGLSAFRYRRRQVRAAPARTLPPVSLLKPLCGLEPNLEAHLASFFEQDYPDLEIVFGTRNASDPALCVVERVRQRYPQVPVKIVFSGEPDRPNAKVCSLEKMTAAARHDYWIISDSDVRVTPDYTRQVIQPLLDPRVGLVTCLYRGVPTGGLWSRLEALGMSVEMTSGVIVADMLEGMKFALGPTMATRREVVEAIGGIGVLADYCADDYVLGDKVHMLGREVVLSSHGIDHVVINREMSESIHHQVRWMRSTRFSRPKGHVGTLLTFAMPFGMLGLVTGAATGHAPLGWGIFAAAVLNRVALALISGWGVVGDRLSLRYCWLYPLRDLLGFGYWVASFFGETIVWRDQRYRLTAGGRMVRIGSAEDRAASETITVDGLA